jgi:hypothetical protein
MSNKQALSCIFGCEGAGSFFSRNIWELLTRLHGVVFQKLVLLKLIVTGEEVLPRGMEFRPNKIIKRREIHHKFVPTEMCDKYFLNVKSKTIQ